MKESTKSKVAFVCHFSNEQVRQLLKLKSWRIRNFLFRLLKHPEFHPVDFDVWVSDFIEQFERHPEMDYHIVATHRGMCQSRQDFDINGIHYHFVKSDSNLFYETLDAKFKLSEKQDYKKNRRRLKKVIDDVNPDLVVLCGAENPEYSSMALDVEGIPVYVLLQTVLNNPQMGKYTNLNVGYKADMEKRIFQKVHYVGTSGLRYFSLYKAINPEAVCLTSRFPSHQPPIFKGIEKAYDFVFYGRLSKNKGIEDVIKAMAIVVRQHPDATLYIIGSADDQYGMYLKQLAADGRCAENVIFTPRLNRLEDLFATIQRGRSVVVPGITAFNSTVRESMLMGLPVVVYENASVKAINAEGDNLLAARMEDVDDLATKMIFVLENPEQALAIAENGKRYAEKAFNNNPIGDKLIANFQAIISNYRNGVPLPKDLMLEITIEQ